jgi:hypothetical protein
MLGRSCELGREAMKHSIVTCFLLSFSFSTAVWANPIASVRSAAEVAFESLLRTPELVVVDKPATALPPKLAWRRINYQARFLVEKPVTFRRTVDRVTLAGGLEKDGECEVSDGDLLQVFRDALAQSTGVVSP